MTLNEEAFNPVRDGDHNSCCRKVKKDKHGWKEAPELAKLTS
jgi:hypothetical protein